MPAVCQWQIGGFSSSSRGGTVVNNYGANNQYGPLFAETYLRGSDGDAGNGATITRTNAFVGDLGNNRCRASPATSP